jgi:hypothetical protein
VSPSTSRTRRLFELDPTSFVVEPWDDPTLAQYGFPVGGDYVETFWLSTLGPTATWLLRRLANILQTHPQAVRLDVAELSAGLGIGSSQDPLAPLVKTLDRLVMFGVAQARRDRIGVRLFVSPLAAKQIDRLPPHLQRSHEAWMTGRRETELPIVASRRVSAAYSAA